MEDVHLTPREITILSELALGHSNKIIAYRLGLAHGTVHTYISQLIMKLRLANRTQLAVWWLARASEKGEIVVRDGDACVHPGRPSRITNSRISERFH